MTLQTDGSKHLVLLVSPTGERFYKAWSAMTKAASEAFAYNTKNVANRAAIDAIHGDQRAFWNCERDSAKRTAERMRGWSVMVVPQTSAQNL